MKCPKCETENPESLKFCGECGTQLGIAEDIHAMPTKTIEVPIEELTTGSIFADRYKIVTELGRGGMGKVYRAIDQKIDEEIAIKLIKPEIAADKKTIERFGNELKMARKIAHRNVCKMYYLGEEKGAHYITMEYVPGEDLKSMIRMSGQLSTGMAIKVAKQVCDGLTEAHRLGVVHRDLKPNNIMIDKSGEARIMDFGIARLLKAKGITGAGIMIGTPEYMSPEQVEGKEVDQRSDIYSLGVILYEMVTGQVPFEGDTPFAIGMKHKGEIPQAPKNMNAQIPEDLNSLILRCLEKEKEQRYQSAGEVRSELEKIEQGLPTTERIIAKKKPTTSREITVKFSLDKHFKWGLIFAAIVVIGVIIWQLLPKKTPLLAPKIENSIAIITFENQTGDEVYDYLMKAIPSLLITNLEQTGDFYVATWERMRDLLSQMGQRDVEIIDSDLGFEICRREGIESIVVGFFVKAGDTFMTDVKVLDVETKKLIKSASTRGRGEDSILQTQIDELGQEISLGLGIAQQQIETSLRSTTDLTTSSMEAYRYLLQGKEEVDNLNVVGAQQSLEKAVELDPQFALAHLYLSDAYYELGSRAAGIESIKNAKAFSEKATEKERLYIEAQYAFRIERDSNKRFRILKELLNKYPKEKDAYYELGMYYYGGGAFREANQEFQRALYLDPNMGAALNMLGYTYSDLGDNEKAIQAFERYAEVMPEDANPLDSMAEQYFMMGDLDKAIEKFNTALEIQPAFGCEIRLAYVYALKQDYSETMRLIEGFVDWAGTPGIKAETYLWMSLYDIILGKIEKAFEDLNKVDEWADKAGNELRHGSAEFTRGWIYYELGDLESSEVHLQRAFDILFGLNPNSKSLRFNYHFSLGLIKVRQGKLEEAKSRLEKIRSIQSELERPGDKVLAKLRHDWLQSEILIEEGSPDQAIRIFENIVYPPFPSMRVDALGPYNLPTVRDTLARAYYESGQLDQAIAEYERKSNFDPQSHDRRLVHPRYRYLLAKLYEEKGEVAKAIEQYEVFLELWKDADSNLPELEDAKKRLASLQSN
ncbi:MAG: protein kinase [Candidatus Aminicenantes bacterium]|nr:MAG: protein kinase [Candidatus Aminicenantes bacterium]